MNVEKTGRNPRDVKVGLKNRIVAALNACPRGIEDDKLTAMLELETGFSEKTIKHVLENMQKVEIVKIDAGIVYINST